MTIEERFNKYKEVNCKHCKNKDKQDCNIRVFQIENVVCTKCTAYEREN